MVKDPEKEDLVNAFYRYFRTHQSKMKTLKFIQKNYGIRDEEILQMMKNAIDTAFADDSIKDKICKMLK